MLIGLSFGAGFLGPLLGLKDRLMGKRDEDAEQPAEVP